MGRFRVPVRVGVAPVQTYQKLVAVDAADKAAAARVVEGRFDEIVNTPGWKAVGGALGPILPDRTTYDTYLDEQSLADWVNAP